MRHYLAEVRLRVRAGTDISWIAQSLEAACRRFEGDKPTRQILSAVYVSDEGRLSCILGADSHEAVHQLLEIALLPAARVYEVAEVLGGTRLLRHPAGDLDPGVDSEVVEDVGHMRLDRPLRQE